MKKNLLVLTVFMSFAFLAKAQFQITSTSSNTGTSGTNWTSTTSGGTLTINVTGSGNINASVINNALSAGTNVMINATGAYIDFMTSITKTGSSNVRLTAKTVGYIYTAPNIAIKSDVGAGKLDVIFWADSDNSQANTNNVSDEINISAGTTIQTNGGIIVLAGGLDNGANGGVNDDGIPDNSAFRGSGDAWGAVNLGPSAGSGTVVSLLSSGGDIIIRGFTRTTTSQKPGIVTQNNLVIDAGSGRIIMKGASTFSHGIEFSYGGIPNIAITSSYSGTGPAIQIEGSSVNSGTGIILNNTTSGNILIQSTALTGGGISIRGDQVSGAGNTAVITTQNGSNTNLQILAGSGDIFLGTTASGQGRTYNYGLVQYGIRKDATLVQGIVPAVTSSNANIILQGNGVDFDATKLTKAATTGSFTVEPNDGSNSFGYGTTFRNVDLVTVSQLTIGKLTNTANLTIASDISVNGPISVMGGDVQINSNITSTAAGDLFFQGLSNAWSLQLATGKKIKKTAGYGLLTIQGNGRINNSTSVGDIEATGTGKLDVVMIAELDGGTTYGISTGNITTNGGRVYIGGGAKTWKWNGLDIGNKSSFGGGGGNAHGIDLTGNITTAGGDILMSGYTNSSTHSDIAAITSNKSLNAGTGNITLLAKTSKFATGTTLKTNIITTGVFSLAPPPGFDFTLTDLTVTGSITNGNFTGTDDVSGLIVQNISNLSGLVFGNYFGTGVNGDTPYSYGNASITDISTAFSINGKIAVYGSEVKINSALSSAASGNAVQVVATAGDIVLKANLTASSNGNILLKSTANILQNNAGESVTTNGGSVIYWADSDGNNSGRVDLTNNASVTTSGGGIWIGGGSGSTSWLPSSNATAITVGNGAANSGTSTYGINLDRAILNAGTGNVWLNGKSSGTSSQYQIGTRLYANANSSGITGQDISITGVGSPSSSSYSDHWGVALIAQSTGTTSITANGTLNINGTGGGSATTGGSGRNHGIWIEKAIITSVGDMTLTGQGGGSATGGTDNDGVVLLNSSNLTSGAGILKIVGTRGQRTLSEGLSFIANDGFNNLIGHATTQTGNIIFQIDGLGIWTGTNSTGINRLLGLGSLTIEPLTGASSFASSITTNGLTLGSGLTGLTLGKANNTADITFGSASNIAGPITAYGGLINVNANLTSTSTTGTGISLNGQRIVQAAGVNVTSSGANIDYTASNLVTTASNDYAIKLGATTGTKASINAQGGNISLSGSYGSTGIAGEGDFAIWVHGTDIKTNNNGTINITGDATNTTTTGSSYGINLGSATLIQTEFGAITLTGTGGKVTSNSRGIVVDGQALSMLSSSGKITLKDLKPANLTGTYTGFYLKPSSTADIFIGSDGSTVLSGTSKNSSSDILIQSDLLTFVQNTKISNFNTAGKITFEPVSNSFGNAITFPSTGLSVANTATGLTIGKATNTANITFGSVTTIAGSITAYGGTISVNENINTTAAGTAGVLLKALDNIRITGEKSITTQGGNVILWANSDGQSSEGFIAIQSNFASSNGAKIQTNGGHIWLGGGSGTATWNGITVGNDYAVSGSAIAFLNSANSGSLPAGILMQGAKLLSGGGDIRIAGSSSLANSRAIVTVGNVEIDAANGKIDIQAIASSQGGAFGTGWNHNSPNEAAMNGNLRLVSNNNSADAIILNADASLSNVTNGDFQDEGSGLAGLVSLITTNGGGITFNSLGSSTRTNAYGLRLGYSTSQGGTLEMLSNSGEIKLNTGNRRIFLANNLTNTTLGFKASSAVTSSSSKLKLITNDLSASGALNFNTNGIVIIEPSGSSFTSSVNTSQLLYHSGVTGLTIGKAGNTASIINGTATSIAGPITFYGGDLSINANLTATNSDINLHASGAVTQSAALNANGLGLHGTGNFTLQHNSNNIATLAGGDVSAKLGSLKFIDAANGLTIGSVNPTGIYSSGDILIETLTGDINLDEPINTTSSTTTTTGYAGAIVLNAGKNSGIGTANGGNIIVGTNGSVSAPNGITKLYSGQESSSTGLTRLVGGLANTRSSVDETTTTFSPVLSATGGSKYAMYRIEQGAGDLTIVASGGTAVGTGWIYDNGVIKTISSPVNINASVLEAYLATGDLTIEAGKVTFNANVNSSSSNAFKVLSKTHILNSSATTITTQGGDVLFASNVDDATDNESATNGFIRLFSLSITTNGGDITLGGGDVQGSSYAMGQTFNNVPEGIRFDLNVSLNSGGGNIVLRGKTPAVSIGNGVGAAGIFFYNVSSGSINSGSGTVLLDGYSQTSVGNAIAGLLWWSTGASMFTIESANTTGNAIILNGFSAGTSGQAYGIETEAFNTLNILATASGGGITVNTGNSIANNYDIVFRGTTNILGKSGPIKLLGGQNGGLANGIFYLSSPLYLGSKAGSTITSSSSNITVQFDRYEWNVGAGIRPFVGSSGSFELTSVGTSFGQGIGSNLFKFGENNQILSGLIIGKSTNTADLTFNEALTVAGPITAYGGIVNVNSNVTSSATGDIFIKAVTSANPSINFPSGVTIGKTGGTGTLTLQGQGRVLSNGSILASGTGVLNTILWSDFDNSNDDGGVSGTGTITTNGGHVWMGGSNTNGGSYKWKGLTVGDGPALGTINGNYNAMDLSGPINTNGGEVLLWVGNGYGGGTNGISSAGSINSGGGDVTLISNVVAGTLPITSTGKLTLVPNGTAFTSNPLVWSTTTSGADQTLTTTNYSGIVLKNSSSLGGLVLGKYDGFTDASNNPVILGNTSGVTISSPISIAGPIELHGGEIAINGNLNTTAGAANGDVLLKASADIVLASSKSITTAGGDVILWSNSDGGTNNGGVFFNPLSAITTGGGHIWIGGGSGTSTWNGLTVGNGYAVSGKSVRFWQAGVMLDETNLQSQGGNIYIAGKRNTGNESGAGIINYSGSTGTLIDSGTGTITMNGEAEEVNSLSDYGIMTGLHPTEYSGNFTIRSSNSTVPTAISLFGSSKSIEDGILIENRTRILSTATSNGGGISISGSAASRNALSIGIGSNSGTLEVLSASGTIDINLGTNPLLIANAGNFRIGSIASDTEVPNSSANVLITSNNVNWTGNVPVRTTGTLTIAPTLNNSFTTSFNTSSLNYTGISSLTIGNPSNTANITFGSTTTIAGPIKAYGGTIAVNGALTATNDNITLAASTAITQTAAITANGLALTGVGSATLTNTSNTINTLAGGASATRTGAINFINSKALTIGSVNPTGIYSSGVIEIATTSGDLLVTEPINSTLATGDAVKLYADKDAAAGAAGDGNIKISGNGSVTIESGARALLYSGSDLSSTGVTTAVGGTANTRTNVDASTSLAMITPSIGTSGKYALYRFSQGEGPLTIVASGGHAIGSTWNYNNGVIATTGTSLANVNASDVQAYLNGTSSLSIVASNIIVDANVTSTTANDLTLKSKGDIVVNSSKSITTAGGDVILWANSDGETTNGGVFFDQSAGISTSGGHIWIGGGSGTTTWNGLTVGNAYAVSGKNLNGLLTRTNYKIDWESGVFLNESTLNSAGGNIYIAGQRNARSNFNGGAGIINYNGTNGTSIDAGTGLIEIKGDGSHTADITFGIMTGLHPGETVGSLTIKSANATAALAIAIQGTNATTDFAGFLVEDDTYLLSTATSNGGGISLVGTSAGNNYGIWAQVGSLNVLSASGPISVDAGTKGIGLHVNTAFTNTLGQTISNTGHLYLGSRAGSPLTNSSANIMLISDRLVTNTGSTINVASTGTFMAESKSTTFSETINTNQWNLGSSLSGLSLGKSSNTRNVTFSNATSISGSIATYGGAIAINGNLTSTLTGASILVKATAGISSAANVNITTNKGDLILWSDSDNTSGGAISIGDNNTINTTNGQTSSNLSGGGKIVLAGGLDNGANGGTANDGIPDGFASNSTNVGVNLGTTSANYTKMYSGGGDIIVRANSTASGTVTAIGLYQWGKWLANSGQGAIDIRGNATSFYGINFTEPVSNVTTGDMHLQLISAKTSGTAISINGTSTSLYGVVFNYNNPKEILATGGGDIVINGTAGGSYAGIFLQNQDILASAGKITLNGGLNGFSFNSAGTRIGSKTGSTIASSTANVTLIANAISPNVTSINTTGTFTFEPFSNSFTSAITYPISGITLGNTISGLTLGKASNSANITFGSATTIAGPITAYGGTISLGANLTSTNGGAISLYSDNALGLSAARTITAAGAFTYAPRTTSFASKVTYPITNLTSSSVGLTIGKPGNLSDIDIASLSPNSGPTRFYGANLALTGAIDIPNSNLVLDASSTLTQTQPLKVAGLGLTGLGSTLLTNPGNIIGTIAGGSATTPTGALSLVNNGSLSVGSVNPTGITSSGLIELETLSGDLLITEPIVSTLATGDAIKLYADKDALAGAAGDGNIKISGNGSVTIESGARALMYSGSAALSTGLSDLATEANTRTNVDATSAEAMITPAITSTGKYALYRSTALSNNANLASLALSTGTLSPVFDPATLTYSATVLAGTSSFNFTPTLSDAAATLTVNTVAHTSGTAFTTTLTSNSTTFNITVVSPDGTVTKKYVLRVLKPVNTVPPPTGTWINLFAGATFDPNNDQQATGDTDIVGNANEPMTQAQQGFYSIGGNVEKVYYFRVRLANAIRNNGAAPSTSFYYGLDLSKDQKIDLVVEANVKASTPFVAYHLQDPSKDGSGPSSTAWLNSTTNINVERKLTTAQSEIRYYAVTPETNVTTNIDLDSPVGGSNTGTDTWLEFAFTESSFKLFTQDALGVAKSGGDVNGLVAFTSTSQTANGDIGGIDDRTADLTKSWAELGVMMLSSLDDVTVPEVVDPLSVDVINTKSINGDATVYGVWNGEDFPNSILTVQVYAPDGTTLLDTFVFNNQTDVSTGDISTTGLSWFINVQDYEPGTYTVKATMSDANASPSSVVGTGTLIISRILINDLVTDDTTPTFTGDTDQPAGVTITVEIRDDQNNLLGTYTTQTKADGTWELTLPADKALPVGNYDLYAEVVVSTSTSYDEAIVKIVDAPRIDITSVLTQTYGSSTLSGTSDQPAGVKVDVVFTDPSGNEFIYQTITNADGTWSIDMTDLPAGDYQIYASLEDANGLRVADQNDLLVNRKELTITGITANDKVYDGTTAARVSGIPVLSGVVSAGSVTLSGTPVYTFVQDDVKTDITVNTTGFTLSGAAAANYTLVQPTLVADITKAPLLIKAVDKSKDLGTADPSLSLSYDGFVNNENETVLAGTLLLERVAGESAGDYVITASGYTSTNYEITYVPGEFIIKPKAISSADVTISSISDRIYNGEKQMPKPVLTDGSKTLVEGVDYTLSYSNNTDVGTATVTITGLGDYNVTRTITFKITPATLTLSPDAGLTKVYGELDPVLTYTYSGNIAGEIPNFSGSLSRDAGQNVGSYEITAGSMNMVDSETFKASNYKLVITSNVEMTITKATLTVKVNDDSKFVTKADVIGYAGVVYEGFVFGEDKSVVNETSLVIARSNNTVEGAGLYSGVLNASGLTASNYDFNYQPGDYTIVAADQLLVKVRDLEVIYGQPYSYQIASAQYLSSANQQVVDLTNNATINNGKVTITDGADGTALFDLSALNPSYSTSSRLEVGSYKIDAINIVETSANFSNTMLIQGNLIVKPKELFASVSGGLTKQYDGNAQMTGLVLSLATPFAGDLVDVSGTGVYNSPNAGTQSYTISDMLLSGDDANNYYVSGGASASLSGTNAVITKRSLVVTPDSGQGKIYGESDNVLTYTNSGAINGESAAFTGLLSRDVGEDPASYEILIGTLAMATNGAFLPSNYELEFTEEVLYTIDKKSIAASDITVAPVANVTYNGQDHLPEPEVKDGATTLVKGTDFTYSYSENRDAGTATIIIAGIGDYSGSRTLTFKINPANLVISPTTGLTKVYGDLDPTLTYTYTGNILGESPGFSGSLSRESGENVGNYKITAGSLAIIDNASFKASNYNLQVIDNVSMAVTKAILTVNVNDDSKFVTAFDAIGYAGINYSGFKFGETNAVIDESNLLISRSNAGVENAGIYSNVLTASGLTSNNYSFAYQTADYTIVPADQLLVKLADIETVYGESATYTIQSATYVTGGNTTVDLTSSTTISNDQVIITDGASGTATFDISIISPVLSTAGKLAVGTYNLGAINITKTSPNFSNTIVVQGIHTVIPKELTVSVTSSKTKVYDGNAELPELELALASPFANDVLSVSGTGKFNSPNAGAQSYTVSGMVLSGDDAANYFISGGAAALLQATDGIITKRELLITPELNQTKLYGALDPVLSFNYSGNVNGEIPGFIGALGRDSGEAQGFYEIRLASLATANNANFLKANYDVLFTKDIYFEILRKNISSNDILVSNISDRIYNGESQTPKPLIKDGDNVLVEGVDYELTYTDNIDAGTSTIVIKGMGNYSGERNISFEINPRELLVSPNAGLSKIYGSLDPSLTYGYSGNVSGETPDFTGSLSREKGENVGLYEINLGSLGIKDNGSFKISNYIIKILSGVDMSITKAPLVVKVNNDSKFVTKPDVNGYAGIRYEGFKFGENRSVIDESNLIITRTNAGIEAAQEYSEVLSASGLASGNYSFTYEKGNFIIVAADQLLVKIANTATIYGDNATYAVASAQYLASSNQQVVDLTTSTTVTNANVVVVDGASGQAVFDISEIAPILSSAGKLAVGTYVLGASNITQTSPNFKNTVVLQGIHTVSPKALTASVTSTKSKVYDGNAQMPDLKFALASPFIEDVLSVSGTGEFASKNAGPQSYTVSGLILSGEDSANYYVMGGSLATIQGTDGLITKLKLRITPDSDQAKIFGETDPILTFTFEGNLRAEIPKFSGFLGREPGELKADYEIELGTLSLVNNGNFLASNYEFDFTPEILFKIDDKSIASTDILVGSITDKIYTGLAHTPKPLLKDGFKTLIEGLDYILNYTENIEAGKATIIINGIGGYSGSRSITFNINKAPLKVIADAKSKVFGTLDPAFTAVITGFVNGETETALTGTLSFTRVQGENVGTYTITPAGLNAANYAISYETALLSILPKAISSTDITVDPINEVIYKGLAYELEPNVKDGTSTLAKDLDYTLSYSNNINAGTASIIISGKNNYSATKTIEFIIRKAPFKVLADDKSKIIGANDPQLTASYSGFVNAETASVLTGNLVISRESGEDIGTYVITPSGLSATNYAISFEQGTFTIGDNVPPTALAKKVTLYLDANGKVVLKPEDVDNGSSDLGGIASMRVAPNEFTCANIGENTVVLTVIDESGNESSISTIVTVVDNIAPTVITRNVTINLDANGLASLTAAQVNNGSFDNCAIQSISIDQTSFDCAFEGTQTVTLTVIDVNGNSASATATVVVVNNTPDTDGDGLKNNCDSDDDNDGLIDVDEIKNGTNPLSKDSDGDGVSDAQESLDGTNPNDPCSFKLASQTLKPSAAWNNGDCDGDGVTNGKEKADGTDPLNGCSLKASSITLSPSEAWKKGDCDGDGLTNEVDGIDDCDKDGTPNFLDPDTCNIDILMANVFTPNGDGINDEIKPVLLGIEKFVCFKVYNRWGNIIFETKERDKGWDGSYRGADQGTETFQWLAEGYDRNGKLVKRTGMITLLR